METLEIADLEALFAQSGKDVAQIQCAVQESLSDEVPKSDEQAKKNLERLLSDPLTRKNLPKWMHNSKHENLALRLLRDPMFVNGFMEKRNFRLEVVKEHYRGNQKNREYLRRLTRGK